jgi:hypothetical protein
MIKLFIKKEKKKKKKKKKKRKRKRKRKDIGCLSTNAYFSLW